MANRGYRISLNSLSLTSSLSGIPTLYFHLKLYRKIKFYQNDNL